MPIHVPSGSKYTPAPKGLFQAVIADVIDVGMRDREWQGKKWQQHQIRVVYELDVPETLLLPDGRRPTHSEWLGLSLDEKSNLRKRIEAIFGRALTDDELPDFQTKRPGIDVETLVGMNCMAQINHDRKQDGSIKARLVAVMPLPPKGYEAITVKDYKRPELKPNGMTDPNEPPPPSDLDLAGWESLPPEDDILF